MLLFTQRKKLAESMLKYYKEEMKNVHRSTIEITEENIDTFMLCISLLYINDLLTIDRCVDYLNKKAGD